MAGKRAERGVALFFFALAVAIWFLIPSQVAASWSTIGIGSRAFPQLAALVMGVLSLLLFGLTFVKGGMAKGETEEPSEGASPAGAEAPGIQRVQRFWVMFGLTLLYAAALDWLGFSVTTALVTFTAMVYLGARPAWKAALLTVLITAAVVYSFEGLMQVSLPKGFWG